MWGFIASKIESFKEITYREVKKTDAKLDLQFKQKIKKTVIDII